MCPFCDKQISPDALRCPFCTSRLVPSWRGLWFKQIKPMIKGQIAAVILLFIFLLFGKYILSALFWAIAHVPAPEIKVPKIGP